jgi:hypothetical protein
MLRKLESGGDRRNTIWCNDGFQLLLNKGYLSEWIYATNVPEKERFRAFPEEESKLTE